MFSAMLMANGIDINCCTPTLLSGCGRGMELTRSRSPEVIRVVAKRSSISSSPSPNEISLTHFWAKTKKGQGIINSTILTFILIGFQLPCIVSFSVILFGSLDLHGVSSFKDFVYSGS